MIIRSPVTDNKQCYCPLFHTLVLKWVFKEAQSHHLPSSTAAGARVTKRVILGRKEMLKHT